MDTLFSNILTVSIQAAIAALIVIMAKKLIIDRINLRIGYLLWILVLIRLLFPILPSSPASIFNMSGMVETIGAQIIPVAASPVPNVIGSPGDIETNTSASVNKLAVSPPQSANTAENHFPSDLFTILACVWAAGAILAGGYHIFVNAVFAARIRRLEPVSFSGELVEKLKAKTGIKRPIQFVESPDVASPCVFGIVRCKIILPSGIADSLDENSLSHVLIHELAHIKHWDLLFIWLSSLLCSLHWFNPILWYCAAVVKRDQELCADAYVMSLSDENGISEYGRTLLSLAKDTGRRRPALIMAGITESRRSLKTRIKSIASFTNKKYRITVLGLLAIVLAGIFLCTSRMDYPKTVEEKQKFDENIMFEVFSDATLKPGSIRLKIHNKNTTSVHSCELEVFYGNHAKPETAFSVGKNFRIGAGQVKDFQIDYIDLKEANIAFSYNYGFSPDSGMNRSGNLMAFDRTPELRDFAAPTEEEIAGFIKTKGIVPLASNKIYNLLSIVMFENGDTSGYYEVYKNTRSDKVESRAVTGIGDHSSQPPVTTMGGTASGIYPFTCIKINDPDLAALSAKMELPSQYGVNTMYMWGAKSYAVETRGYGSIRKILIYDRDDKLLYESEEF